MVTLIRVNLLEALGPELGFYGEWLFASLFRKAARGESVAMLLEGMYSYSNLRPRSNIFPTEARDGVYSRHVSTTWPIHKSWFVPAVDNGEPVVYVDPPKGFVKYIGRDTDGSYEYLLYVGLGELKKFVLEGAAPIYLKGVDSFTNADIEAASLLYPRLEGGEGFVSEVIETLRQVDFILLEGGTIYHVEVKTTAKPEDSKLRKKRLLLQRRQQILEKLGLKPALAVVVPRENWEVEIWLEK
ncbi:hypothetical protein HC235_10105 [Pyrobaculum arsenaticum]|uniref:Uncharacterized protein n=2 Tax=Pyrobaculum arsenaticum TaxID=121277 RepID=A4WLT7_PYRAR|nr:conserved hypothetical protein [Pyrobaculum arsenaticum DSM 13514]NYR16276.1 hypothetical protein [Pyrobaculum arsenaticum]